MRIVVGQRLFSTSGQSLPVDFEEFLRRSIERMRPSVLKTSLSYKSHEAQLVERAWQMEWYTAATSIMSPAVTVSPDVSPVFGASGYLDFYVNGDLQWGVELVRKGIRLWSYVKHFLSGPYTDIPLKRWAIIDFRANTKGICGLKDPKDSRGAFWYAMYTEDFREITICRSRAPDETLVLQGDEYQAKTSTSSSL